MTNTEFTPEEGAELASLLGINGENNESDVEESQDDLETDDVEVEADESDDEPDNSEEEEEAPQKATETPKKKKSGLNKVFSERNELRARVAELEAKIQNNEHTTDDFLEYTKSVSRQTAHESQEVQKLLEQYPESAVAIKSLDSYADTTGSLESAYKAYLAVNNPELYVKTFVSKQNQAKMNSGKLSPAGVGVPRPVEKVESKDIVDDDADAIRKLMGF